MLYIHNKMVQDAITLWQIYPQNPGLKSKFVRVHCYPDFLCNKSNALKNPIDKWQRYIFCEHFVVKIWYSEFSNIPSSLLPCYACLYTLHYLLIRTFVFDCFNNKCTNIYKIFQINPIFLKMIWIFIKLKKLWTFMKKKSI